jgi:hypothetical protein
MSNRLKVNENQLIEETDEVEGTKFCGSAEPLRELYPILELIEKTLIR